MTEDLKTVLTSLISPADNTITLSFKLSKRLINDILTIADEGGVNYWADGVPNDLPGLEFRIREQEASEDGTPKELDVTATAVCIGVARMLQSEFNINPKTRGYLFLAISEDDGCYIDTDVADAIVQAAMFNDLVYG